MKSRTHKMSCSQGTGNICALGAEVLLRHTYITPEVYSQHPKIWDHQGVKITWEVHWGLQNSAQSGILSLLYLENENQNKVSSGVYLISPTLRTSLFRKEKPKSLSPPGWASTVPTLQYSVAANTKAIKSPIEKLAQDFSLLRASQLPKGSEQPSPSTSSTNSKAYMWASTTH